MVESIEILDTGLLTKREQEVFKWHVKGLSHKRIAVALTPEVTLKTVDAHLAHIIEKLNALNGTHVITKGIQLGIVRIQTVKEQLIDQE